MSTSPPLVVADRYRLVAPLGQGGMGRVWRATDVVLHREVAIKELVPPPGLTHEERQEMRERSLREARAIARLNNVNVVRVFDVLRTDADPWIVMEYVPSSSLQDRLASDGPYPAVRAAEIGLGVLNALRAAHRNGVVHRDVKPGNVLIGEDGRVVLTDFGLATLPGNPDVTRTGLVLGSPAYIAPERARDGTAGPGADLWSLGATLYAAVEGSSPFARPSAIATLAALATENPPPARNAGALKPVLNGLLRKDPAHRINAEEAERLLLRATGRRSRLTFPMSPTMRRPGVGRERPAPSTPPVVPGASGAAASTPVVPGPRPPVTRPQGETPGGRPVFAPGKASVGRPATQDNPTKIENPSGTRSGAKPETSGPDGPPVTPGPASSSANGALAKGTRGAYGAIPAAEVSARARAAAQPVAKPAPVETEAEAERRLAAAADAYLAAQEARRTSVIKRPGRSTPAPESQPAPAHPAPDKANQTQVVPPQTTPAKATPAEAEPKAAAAPATESEVEPTPTTDSEPTPSATAEAATTPAAEAETAAEPEARPDVEPEAAVEAPPAAAATVEAEPEATQTETAPAEPEAAPEPAPQPEATTAPAEATAAPADADPTAAPADADATATDTADPGTASTAGGPLTEGDTATPVEATAPPSTEVEAQPADTTSSGTPKKPATGARAGAGKSARKKTRTRTTPAKAAAPVAAAKTEAPEEPKTEEPKPEPKLSDTNAKMAAADVAAAIDATTAKEEKAAAQTAINLPAARKPATTKPKTDKTEKAEPKATTASLAATDPKAVQPADGETAAGTAVIGVPAARTSQTPSFPRSNRPAWQPMTAAPVTRSRGLTVFGVTLTRRQTVIGVAILAAIVLLLGILIPVAFAGDDENKGNGQPGVVPSGNVVAPPTGAASQPPSAAPSTAPSTQPSSAPPKTSAAPPANPLPAGWTLYKDKETGFSVPLPKGFAVSRRTGSEVYFKDNAGSGRLLIIDQRPDPQPDPVKDWEAQEKERRGTTYPDYDRIRIDAVGGYFRKAADWEFTYRTKSGNAQHAQKRGFIVSAKKAYGISWYTSPDDWNANKPALEAIYKGFKPA